MKFLDKVTKIETDFCDDQALKDNVKLYGLNMLPPPLAKHMIFLPMPDDVKEQMLDRYKRQFPNELLMLYSKMNGANLFWTTICVGKSGVLIPYNFLSIYGAPLNNNRNHIEPFDISIEDCRRPSGTPDEWLKFGSFTFPDDPHSMIDLFMDTVSKNIYGVNRQDVREQEREEMLVIQKSWNSMDECLCELFEELETRETSLGEKP